MSYTVNFLAEVYADLKKLDKSRRDLVMKQIEKLKTSPELGDFLGHKADLDLSGLRKLYADNKRIRIVYKIIEERIEVLVIVVGSRDDMEVYKTAAKRTE